MEEMDLACQATITPARMVVVLAIIVARKKSDFLNQHLRRPSLRWFGKYSYGVYIVQLPLVTLLPISTMIWALGLKAMNPIVIGLVYLVNMVALTCVVA